jgi:hypothetical protein
MPVTKRTEFLLDQSVREERTAEWLSLTEGEFKKEK